MLGPRRVRAARWLLPAVVVGGLAALAAWALVADDKAGWTVVSGVLAAVAGAFFPSVVDGLRARAEARAQRERSKERILVPDLPGSVAWLLHPDKKVIGFFGRGWVLRQLMNWCEDSDAAVVRLVTAGGGYGKSRLAQHFATRLDGWECWRVRVGGESDTAALLQAGDVPGRLLMIIDYADSREPAALAEVLCAAARRAHGRDRVRALLLARTAGPWWTSLSASYPQQAALVDSMTGPNNVIALEARPDDRSPQEIIAGAAIEFAAHLRYNPPRQVPPRQHDPDTPLLRLHAEALLTVLGGSSSSDGRHDVLAEVMGHETRYWRGRARHAGLPLPGNTQQADTLQRQLVGVAALIGADDDQEIADIVRRAPTTAAAQPSSTTAWVDWLRTLYPASDVSTAPGRLGTLQPDLLAEYLAVNVLTTCTGQQRAAILTGLSAAQAVQALTVLGRADAHQPDVTASIDAALTADTVTMAHAVLRVAPQFPGLYAARLAPLLATADLDPTLLRTLAEQVPYPSMELNQVALALTTRITSENRAATSASDQAGWLTSHALRLAEAGRRAEALTASQEALDLRRELAGGNRDAYLPDLAMSVNNHAGRLAEAGRRAEALTGSKEAVDLYRELAGGNRDAYLPNLAMSVNNRANRLAAAGQRAEALTASQEAVDLYRELVAGNRDAYLPDLAASVNNHALRLAEAGQRAEALIGSKEALDLYRELVAGSRDAHLPNLATSLWTTGSVCLTVDGPMDLAVAASTEAVRLFDVLAAGHPEAFTDRLHAAARTLADVHEAMDNPGPAAEIRARYGF